MNPTELGPDGLPLDPLPVPPEEEQNSANRLGDALGGTGDAVEGAVGGMDLLGSIGEGVSSAASATADAIGSVASGAAEVVSGAAAGIGSAVEGLGSAGEGVGAVAEGCGSCSLALLLMLASVGAAVAAVLR